MEYNEREKYSTMLLTAWIAKWLCVFPEGRDESPEGDPQQLPDSGRYRPRPEQQTIKDVYPTDAKAREKERRKAQKASGKAHLVKKRVMKIEDHFDDCGEDLSSLKGVELCSLAWTSSLDEEAEPFMSETAYAHECDGITTRMFYGPCDTPDMKHLSMVVLPNITALTEMFALKTYAHFLSGPRRRRSTEQSPLRPREEHYKLNLRCQSESRSHCTVKSQSVNPLSG